jgi:hypothetical protein
MVTHAGLTEFEHETPKIVVVSERVVTLSAGDALRGARLAQELGQFLPSGPITLRQTADQAVQVYAGHRRQQIEAEVFAPRGLSMQQFYTGGIQPQLLPQLVGVLDQQVMGFNYGVDLLLAGVDDIGAHLYLIGNPGDAQDFGVMGFEAIGSGALHAVQAMIGFGHSPLRALNETVFSVYASKRRAEVAPGVGRDTDLALVLQDGVKFLPQSVLSELETVYQDYQRPLGQEQTERVRNLDVLVIGDQRA